jgi:hypothetical protein
MARRKKDVAIPTSLVKPKRGRPPKDAGAPKAARAAKKHNTAAESDQRTEDQIRAGFLHHRQAWNQMTAKQKAIDKQWTDVKAALKADGYKVLHMQVADDLAGSPKAEAKVHTAVQDRLQVARWIGHPMGAQLDLFGQPDRTPATDKAYDEGKQAFMEDKRATPPYAPGVPQYTQWLAGWHAAQDARVRGGLKPLVDDRKAAGWGLEEQEDGDDDTSGWGESDPGRPLDAA